MTKVIFCIPGKHFSHNFIRSWTDLLNWCKNNRIEAVLSSSYHEDQYQARNLCLGGKQGKSTTTKPFDGKKDYDYLMWIDSDQVFTPDHFEKLLQHDLDIVTGVYLTENLKTYPCVEKWDEESFDRDGGFRFTLMDELKEKQGVFEVVFNGLGFALFKWGVFESLEYPWFRPYDFATKENRLNLEDDLGLFFRLRENGYRVFVDPEVIVGHDKRMLLGIDFNPKQPIS